MLDNEDAVEPQNAEPIEQVIDQHDADSNDNVHEDQVERPKKTMIPLSVAQKLREKNREVELELQWEKQERLRLQEQVTSSAQPKIEDNSRYESATREDLSKSQQEIVRIVEEKQWIKNNPEKYEIVNEFLPKFLKQRPNLTSAINQATNRYEEAYTLIDALSPKQQKQLSKVENLTAKKEAPNAPGGVPKAAALNQAVDIMKMNDTEYRAWRNSQKKSR